MRLIDADALFDFLTEQLERETGAYSKGRNVGLNIARSFLPDENSVPTIDPPPNDPLTLEELREMDGEPVYVRYPDSYGEWGLVEILHDDHIGIRFRDGLVDIGGKYGLLSRGAGIYRRRPEEGMT